MHTLLTLWSLLGCAADPYELWWLEAPPEDRVTTTEIESNLIAWLESLDDEDDGDDSGWTTSTEHTYSPQGVVVRVDRADDGTCVVRDATTEWVGVCDGSTLDAARETSYHRSYDSTQVTGFHQAGTFDYLEIERIEVELTGDVGSGTFTVTSTSDGYYSQSDLWDPEKLSPQPVQAGDYANGATTVDCDGPECEVREVTTAIAVLDTTWTRIPLDSRADGLIFAGNNSGPLDFLGHPR